MVGTKYIYRQEQQAKNAHKKGSVIMRGKEKGKMF
jgi:hypothetical protein